ncbi:hypothetical protein Bca4012_076007 [Brassica carinata]|uniref:Uncharacterized protein n=2 Tax=Brassica TaxID=3705 RepID=A0A3P6E6L7_BRAOL|nr:unnamed protein product [Brassica napus]VDD35600.1 unnamed protein product [Brassica oleracea]
MAFGIDKNPIRVFLVLVVSLRRCFLFSFSEILSSFLVVADLHAVVDLRFSAQGAREGSDLYDELVKAIKGKTVGRDHLIFGVALHLACTFCNVIMIVEIMVEELVDVFKHKVMLKSYRRRGQTCS